MKHDLEKTRSEKNIYFKQLEHTKIIEIKDIASKILHWERGEVGKEYSKLDQSNKGQQRIKILEI